MFQRIGAFVAATSMAWPVAIAEPVADLGAEVEWLRQWQADPTVHVPREEVPDADRLRWVVANYALDRVGFGQEDLALLQVVQREEQELDRKIEDELRDSF